MKTSANGRKLITDFEGCVLSSYRCPAGVLTIGVGHTSAAGTPLVTDGMKLSPALADDILSRDLVRFEAGVNKLVKVPLTQDQFDALVSFTFNLGEGALKSSTLLKRLNAGDYAGAALEFLKWNRANGQVLPGLTRRRTAEAKLFGTTPPTSKKGFFAKLLGR